MRKYVYENAIVYITEPTEEQLENIKTATEKFVRRLAKEGLMTNEQKRNNRRTSRTNFGARKRDRETRK